MSGRLERLAPVATAAAMVVAAACALPFDWIIAKLPAPPAAVLLPALAMPAVILLLPGRLAAWIVRAVVPVAMLGCVFVNVLDFARLNQKVFCPLAMRSRHDLVSLAENPRTWRELGQYHMYGLIRRYAQGRRIVTHDEAVLSRWYLTMFAGVAAWEVRPYHYTLTADQAEALKRLEHHRLQHPQVPQDVHYLIVPPPSRGATCDFRIFSFGHEHFLVPESMPLPEPASTGPS